MNQTPIEAILRARFGICLRLSVRDMIPPALTFEYLGS